MVSRTTTDAATRPALRQGTKIARVVELLQRDQSVRLEELIAATGYDVRLERDENGGSSVYRAPSIVGFAS